MIKERAKELAEALESGKYQQTQKRLHDKDGFCCLGVACDISGLAPWVAFPDDPAVYTYRGKIGTLPPDVMTYFGFKSPAGEVDDDTTLASMNDTGKTFSEIAAFIRENWERL